MPAEYPLQAWYKLKEAEAGLGLQVLDTSSGGAHGKGASLTPAGRELVRRYHELVDGWSSWWRNDLPPSSSDTHQR